MSKDGPESRVWCLGLEGWEPKTLDSGPTLRLRVIMMSGEEIKLDRIEEFLWEIPKQGGMRVPGRIYATEKLMSGLKSDNSLRQVMNVAHLPGIVGYSLAMPDIHWGYGFPIGGVAALNIDGGVISPGGVGYDIN